MNYQIITNEGILKEYIATLSCTEEEQYYCCLFARSKYTKDNEGKNGISHISSDKAQLKRFTSTPDRLFQKIQQLECPIGAYFQRDVVVPQEALALYISANPRNLWKATQGSLKHFAEVVCTNGRTMNPQADAMSQIQKAKGTTNWVVFDIDDKSPKVIKRVRDYLEGSAYYRILETRGGIHVMISPKNIHQTIAATWYTVLGQIADQTGDMMIPVPGSYQGGFTPHFI